MKRSRAWQTSRPSRARRFAAAKARAGSIGARIEGRLLELGLTQAQLARQTGISTSTMSRIVLGETVIQPRVLVALSRALNVSGHWLLNGENAAPLVVGASETLIRGAFASMARTDRRRLLIEFLTIELGAQA